MAIVLYHYTSLYINKSLSLKTEAGMRMKRMKVRRKRHCLSVLNRQRKHAQPRP
jgi:hypothetical protein